MSTYELQVLTDAIFAFAHNLILLAIFTPIIIGALFWAAADHI